MGTFSSSKPTFEPHRGISVTKELGATSPRSPVHTHLRRVSLLNSTPYKRHFSQGQVDEHSMCIGSHYTPSGRQCTEHLYGREDHLTPPAPTHIAWRPLFCSFRRFGVCRTPQEGAGKIKGYQVVPPQCSVDLQGNPVIG